MDRNNSWIPLQKDELINDGEVISTSFKSELLIRYKSAVMKLGPLTRITLEKLASAASKDDVSVYLNTGTIRSTVNHSDNRRISYTVRNPIAVASVRGTDFAMDGQANVDCYSGGVIVVPADIENSKKNAEIDDSETGSRNRRAKKRFCAEGRNHKRIYAGLRYKPQPFRRGAYNGRAIHELYKSRLGVSVTGKNSCENKYCRHRFPHKNGKRH